MPFELDAWEKEALGRKRATDQDSARVIALLQRALRRAIAEWPDTPPAEFPFRLSTDELEALSKARRFIRYEGDFMRTDTVELVGAIDRAVRTLAAPKVEALSEGEEFAVQALEEAVKNETALTIIRRSHVRPEKTPGQVFFEKMHPEAQWSHCMNKDQVERAVQAAVDYAKVKP